MALTPQRLKKLVAYRERLERLQEGALARELQRKSERQAALFELERAREELIATAVPEGTIDPSLYHTAGIYLRALDRQVEARRAALTRSDAEVERERLALMERRRDRKAVEALLEARLADERVARGRKAMAAIDEQAAIRWARERGPDR